MIVYAIKHTPTGKFMPLKFTRRGARGWSNWNPGVRDGFDTTPRIFKDHISALRALNAWLKGKWEFKVISGPGDYDGLLQCSKQPNRKREDMKIVKFQMIEIFHSDFDLEEVINESRKPKEDEQMTPSDIEVLLHYNANHGPHPRSHAPAVRDTIEKFIRYSIIEATSDKGELGLTPKGKAWLSLICNVPMPTPAWVDAQGNVIK